jgi:hypothetical protein
MHWEHVQRGEIIACVAGFLLAIAVFLPWYKTDPTNPNSQLNGDRGEFSAWAAHNILRFLLLGAAIAPFILTWIIIREHQLSWPRGELTAVVAITSLTLILVAGFIARPGDPRDTIGVNTGLPGPFEVGWWLAALASAVMLVGAVQRTTEIKKTRKAPGTV